MVQTPITLPQLRRLIQNSWEELAQWLLNKPRLFSLPRPEQQIAFEYAARLRETLRSLVGSSSWDRLYFDASSLLLPYVMAESLNRRAPLYIDTRQLFGIGSSRARTAAAPDVAIAIQALRSCGEIVDFDEEGQPRNTGFIPVTMREQGFMLEEHVRHLEELSHDGCDGWLFVVYSNEAGRRTPVDRREVASWATWQQPSDKMWWASRHFRVKGGR